VFCLLEILSVEDDACVLLRMLETVNGALYLLEALKVMRCVLLCAL